MAPIALNIAELRLRAKQVLPQGLFEFVDRGCEDEEALRGNRDAISKMRLIPRVLKDVSGRDQQVDLLGKPSSLPIAIAPTGAAGLLWFDGEIEVAKAAAKAGVPFTLSTASIVSMERVADAARGGRLWFQLYMWPDREMSYRLVDRVRTAGYETLMVTVDNAAAPNREYNVRNGFGLPMKVTRKNALDVALHPGWFCRVFARYLLREGIPMLENYPEELRQRLSAQPTKRQGLPRNDSLTWNDLQELRRRWKGPLLVKGILHPDDAEAAIRSGVDGIVVSNHGGRNFDASPAPVSVLPRIVEQVNGRAQVFVDGGFQRGTDVVKAIALGAQGVLVGRAPLWGVAAAGEAGVSLALSIFRDEIHRTMGLIGSRKLVEPDICVLDRNDNQQLTCLEMETS